MANASILIVEDEPEIAELMQFHLAREGFSVKVLASGREALGQVDLSAPDLILLDLMLPDLDGLEVCRRLKRNQQTRHVPILIVSAKGEEADIVTGIELGADDYVTKPFSPRVLVARVKNVLRRMETEPAEKTGRDDVLRLGEGALVVDVGRHVVTAHGRTIDLTLTEFGILQYLAKHPGFVRTRDQIIGAVHGGDTVLSSRTVDVHVTALRRKLGDLGAMVQTVRGVGYRMGELSLVTDE
ncbi:MAG: response regulator transcription factor [Phycisphaerales bacterium]|nr:response regulator transcription factor [Phycisphaerales bacterium]MCI0631528.1 response regulator transcription factor [Phycisphaerales bacterium]